VGAGVIDAGYEPGEILVKIFNVTKAPVTIEKGTAICQGLFIKVETPMIVECSVEQLENSSERSAEGGILTELFSSEFIFDSGKSEIQLGREAENVVV
jgi:hypothetical protein